MNEQPTLIDRGLLYEEVWTDPVITVAQRYGLSDVGLAKICRRLKIPLPGRGYWAKLNAGKPTQRTRLPKVDEGELPNIRVSKPDPATSGLRAEAKEKAAIARAAAGTIAVPGELSDPHPLVRAAAQRFRRRDGWDNEKGLRSAPAEILHIEVTKGAVDRALLLADTLIKELTRQSIGVRIDKDRKETVPTVEGTDVTLMLSEHVRRTPHEETPQEKRAKELYWSRSRRDPSVSFPFTPRFDFHPTGVLTITAGHWPSRSWKDTPLTRLENRLAEVVAGIVLLAADIRAKDAEEARRQERHRQAKERHEFLMQRLENEKKKFGQLEADAGNWERAQRIRCYVEAVEQDAVRQSSETSELRQWVAWARAKADWLDPLIVVSDPILDAPEPKLPGYYF